METLEHEIQMRAFTIYSLANKIKELETSGDAVHKYDFIFEEADKLRVQCFWIKDLITKLKESEQELFNET